MAREKVEVTVKYAKSGTQPPIYLAGSFLEPEWRPQEMEYTTTEQGEHEFFKKIEVQEGAEYQYKFRVGEGNWWLLNEESPVDAIGNRNNLLTVPAHKEPKKVQHSSGTEKPVSAKDVQPVPVPEDELEVEAESEPEITSVVSPYSHEREATGRAEDNSHQSRSKQTTYKDFMGDNKEIFGHRDHPILKSDAEPGSIKAVQIPIPQNEANPANETKKVGVPTMVVDEFSPEPRDDHNLPQSADPVQDRNQLLPLNIEADRVRSVTPEMADTAAEVADSAAILDQEDPSPEVSDDEAGRIGLRRLSLTPIPQVANVAAEVADVAAMLDKGHDVSDMPGMPQDLTDTSQVNVEETPVEADLSDPDSGAVTPWEERAPLFSHECLQGPVQEDEPSPTVDTPPIEFSKTPVYDRNDPNIEVFPSEREAILERVRSSQIRLSEDTTYISSAPSSPVVVSGHHSEQGVTSSGLLAQQRSPSLNSIAEDREHQEEVLSPLPQSTLPSPTTSDPALGNGSSHKQQVPSVSVHRARARTPSPKPGSLRKSVLDNSFISPMPVGLPATPFVHDSGKELGDGMVIPVEAGPIITVQPATPGNSLRNRSSDFFAKSDGSSTSVDEGRGRGQMVPRKTASPGPDRPVTPTSLKEDPASKSFLKTFLRILFVDWIGGFIRRLCGGGGHA